MLRPWYICLFGINFHLWLFCKFGPSPISSEFGTDVQCVVTQLIVLRFGVKQVAVLGYGTGSPPCDKALVSWWFVLKLYCGFIPA